MICQQCGKNNARFTCREDGSSLCLGCLMKRLSRWTRDPRTGETGEDPVYQLDFLEVNGKPMTIRLMRRHGKWEISQTSVSVSKQRCPET